MIVSVTNLTSLGCVISQSTGHKLATKSVARANDAMAIAQQTHSAINSERIKKKKYLE